MPSRADHLGATVLANGETIARLQADVSGLEQQLVHLDVKAKQQAQTVQVHIAAERAVVRAEFQNREGEAVALARWRERCELLSEELQARLDALTPDAPRFLLLLTPIQRSHAYRAGTPIGAPQFAYAD